MTEQEFEYYQLVCKRPGMFVVTAEFNAVCAYIDGRASVDRSLLGFREWLVVKADTGDCFGWPGLVGWLANKNQVEGDERKIAFLGGLLDEFYQFGKSFPHNTLLVCYLRYYEWLKSKSWYHDASPHYIDPEILKPTRQA